MFKGFYNLTSGMLSQGRRLDVISNNMVNVATSGYKADTYTDSTFQEYIVSRIGNKIKNPEEIGGASYILAPSQLYTDFSGGAMEQTDLTLDFGLEGDGFFAVETADGVAYTRAGSFALDDEGYLVLPGAGRVLDISEQPIYLGTDMIHVDSAGVIYTNDGAYMGQLGVFSFEDNGELERNPQGLFVNGGDPQASTAVVHWKMIERANVDLVKEMTSMITAQRAYQSAAEISKMYDELMTKASTNLGNV